MLISKDIKVIAVDKKQVLIRLSDAEYDWLECHCNELGISKPQFILSLLKAEMPSSKGISNDITDDISASDSASKDELEQKVNDIESAIKDDINALSVSLSLMNSDLGIVKGLVGDNRLAIDDIGTDLSNIKGVNVDILQRLAIVEQWINTRPKRGRPPKSV